MRLRKRVLRQILLVAIISTGAIYAYVRHSLFGKLAQIEMSEQADRIEILNRHLDANLLAYGNWNLEYSNWTDTSEFAEGGRSYYLEVNFPQSLLGASDDVGTSQDMTADHVFVYNGQRLVGYAGYDEAEDRRVTTPNKTMLKAAEDLIAKKKPELGKKATTGFMYVKHMSYEYALSRITDSEGQADGDSVFLTIRRWGPVEIEDLSRFVDFNLSWLESTESGDNTFIEDDNIMTDHKIAGFDGNPAFTVRLKAPRTAFALGKDAMPIFLFTILWLMCSTFAVLWIMFDRLLTRRIANLHDTVRLAHSDRGALARIETGYRDEIADLGFEVRRLFEAHKADHPLSLAKEQDRKKSAG
jgi:sensor domain CHASE-containing protein